MNPQDNRKLDLSGWRTTRLQFLLSDYETALDSLERLQPGRRKEIWLYWQWIKAIREELSNRERSKWIPRLRHR
jgi:hypothetical protein